MLILMRHGEASWDTYSDDKGRQLTASGVAFVGQQRVRYQPQLASVQRVISSSYARARQTSALMLEGMPGVEWVIDDRWSPEASLSDAMDSLEEHWVENLLVVTHQPIIGYAVCFLLEGNTCSPEPLLPGQLVTLNLLWPGRASAMRLSL
ncbi:phosphoglycerate mutase family protein [Neptunomonas sp.]|uniref:phosphoglycerate mutase family protein n=1 Tax=Neptunomonas sp. TaxID=1971898 RepID=UPI003563C66D